MVGADQNCKAGESPNHMGEQSYFKRRHSKIFFF